MKQKTKGLIWKWCTTNRAEYCCTSSTPSVLLCKWVNKLRHSASVEMMDAFTFLHEILSTHSELSLKSAVRGAGGVFATSVEEFSWGKILLSTAAWWNTACNPVKNRFFFLLVGTGTNLRGGIYFISRSGSECGNFMPTTLLGSCSRAENRTLSWFCFTVSQYFLIKRLLHRLPLEVKAVSISYCTPYLQQNGCYVGTTFTKSERIMCSLHCWYIRSSYKDGIYPATHVQWASNIFPLLWRPIKAFLRRLVNEPI